MQKAWFYCYLFLIACGVFNVNTRPQHAVSDCRFIDSSTIIKEKGKIKPRDKFFLYSNLMGRLNNQLIAAISSIYWSNYLDRVLVFPGWNEHSLAGGKIVRLANVPFEKYFDIDFFCDNYPYMIYMDNYYSRVQSSLTEKDVKFRTDIPNIYFNRNFTRGYLTSQLAPVKEIHLQVGITYRWNIPRDEYARIMAFFRPKPQIVQFAELFVSRNLVRPYAAIHIRRWEGACKMPKSEILEIVSKRLGGSNIKSVFLASDGQDIELQSMIIEKFNATVQNVDFSDLGIYSNGIIDGYILAQSNVFFANRHSNLSKNWYRYRLGKCRPEWRKVNCDHQKAKTSLLCQEIDRTRNMCSQEFEVVIMSPNSTSNLCR